MIERNAGTKEIQFFAPRWGREHQDIGAFAKDVKEAGYHGVETSLPMDPKERNRWVSVIQDHDLLLIAQHWETFEPNVTKHAQEYETRLNNLAAAKPIFINSQTGRDFFSIDQNLQMIKIANKLTDITGIPVYHETHRGKMSFAAHIMAQLLKEEPEIAVTLDISHWCCVAETLLEDQAEAVEQALKRATHIHARVGFPEGPQVGNPLAPEWKDVLYRYLGWWQQVVDYWNTPGHLFTGNTITMEAGPVPYMPTVPYKNQPVADQWHVNLEMMKYLKKELS